MLVISVEQAIVTAMSVSMWPALVPNPGMISDPAEAPIETARSVTTHRANCSAEPLMTRIALSPRDLSGR